MLCGGIRIKDDHLRPEQKWEFISLNDFKSGSCVEIFAYGYLWVQLLISVAVYAVDTFTAVNLLAFDKYTGITPYISLSISKWIFCGCIILSWLNLGYEHIRAYRIIKRGGVAESFLDSLAVRLQCIRITKKGRGWRRFLVFSELAKSKKGAEYVALFTFYSFQAWVRVIFCSGPRQVINALTLYSVFEAKFDHTNTDVSQAILVFFKNLAALAEENYQQALILGGMLFTLTIWVFAALSLLLALVFYLLFLWHYIPNDAGGLSGYCANKVNKKLKKIVSKKVNMAIADEERKVLKEAKKAAGKNSGVGDEKSIIGRKATVPTVLGLGDGDDRPPGMPQLGRTDTMSSLPSYASRPGTPSGQQGSLGMELSDLNGPRRPPPSRMGTQSSFGSVTSNAPLMGDAGAMGYGGRASPAPSLPPLDRVGLSYPTPQRTMTANTMNSQYSRQGPPRRGPTPLSRQESNDDYFGQPTIPQELYTAQQGYNSQPIRAPTLPQIPQETYMAHAEHDPRHMYPTSSPHEMYASPMDYNAPRLPTPDSASRYDAYGQAIITQYPEASSVHTSRAPYPEEMPGAMRAGHSTSFAAELPVPEPIGLPQPTVPFIAEMPDSSPNTPTQQSFAVEMPAPGSTPKPHYADLAVTTSPAPSHFSNNSGRSSPAPSQLGRKDPIQRLPMTSSPVPRSAGGYVPCDQSRGPYNPGMQGHNPSSSQGSNRSGPYRNMTEPVRQGTPQQSFGLEMPRPGTSQGLQGPPQRGLYSGHGYSDSDASSVAPSIAPEVRSRNGVPPPLQPPGGYRR